MKQLRTARAALLRRLGRLNRRIVKLLPDAHVYAGVGLIAFGAGQIAAALAPIVAGAGLILIVRYGAR